MSWPVRRFSIARAMGKVDLCRGWAGYCPAGTISTAGSAELLGLFEEFLHIVTVLDEITGDRPCERRRVKWPSKYEDALRRRGHPPIAFRDPPPGRVEPAKACF